MITKSELKAKNKAVGHYFFSRDTMRFFNSRLETGGYYGASGGDDGWFFVYSNQFVDGRGKAWAREYMVAFMREDGTVKSGNRPTFGNLREAHAMAKKLAKESME